MNDIDNVSSGKRVVPSPLENLSGVEVEWAGLDGISYLIDMYRFMDIVNILDKLYENRWVCLSGMWTAMNQLVRAIDGQQMRKRSDAILARYNALEPVDELDSKYWNSDKVASQVTEGGSNVYS